VAQIETAKQAEHGFLWAMEKAGPEWVQLFGMDLFPQLRERGLFDKFSKQLVKQPKALKFITEFVKLAA